MDKIERLRKPLNFENELLLKSSPNILENFPYEDFKEAIGRKMTSPPASRKEPMFSETIEKNMFMKNVINMKGYSGRYASPKEKEASVRRSLEEISKDIKEMEDFITVTETLIQKEKERDKELYARERKRRQEEKRRKSLQSPNKENKSPPHRRFSHGTTSPPTFKINSFKRNKNGSPKYHKSKLYFRNGKIGCVEIENIFGSNIQSTHALVRNILKYENEKPLVSPDSVRRALTETNLPGQVDLFEDIMEEKMMEEIGGDKIDDMDIASIPVEDPRMVFTHLQMSTVGMLMRSKEQVRHLVRRFTARTKKVKSRLELPPTPSSSASSPSPTPTGQKDDIKSQSPINKLVTRNYFQADTPKSKLLINLCGGGDDKTLDPQGKFYISWLCVVSLSFLYNAWVIPLRATFPFQTPENTNTWLTCDFIADTIYLLDLVFVKHRVMYLFEGFWVKDKNLTRKNYMRKLQFKLDILSLLPLDLLYFVLGTQAVYVRFPRLLKIQSFWEVFKLLDRVISSPHFVRIAKTLTYMVYMIHLTACSYYAYSDAQELGSNRWVFSGKGHPYVRCFAFATKTATSIGKNPKPEKEGEYVFMTAAWLMGVFVFALLIGQIRDIISTATRTKNEYRQLEDETLEYMRRLNLPGDIQRRVKMWFKFTWDQQRTLDESNILDSLPINLKTDIAISVHIQTLSKVQLFADCEEALLRDLVLKLRAVTFLPGDCQVQVMGGPNNDIVLATLYEGSVFGEISLLGINGADRRTADVRAKGFANLFVLSKADLNEVIVYYPNAQAILKKRARSLMRKNAAREREEARKSAMKADVVIGNPKTPETPPKLLRTVIQALPTESPAVMLITKGSRKRNKEKENRNNEVNVKVENEKRPKSPDLLSSIQDELKTNNKNINLTDSEKALILSSASQTSLDKVGK
uniref:Cyclic nucleotide-binding domain-containing protein n=1 Tax=Megaselia scalaris TaxID=36166 RepID=T1GMQ1_MEGSC